MDVTKLKLRLKDSPPAAACFTQEQLKAIEASFCVVTPPNTRLVCYDTTPPTDTRMPWQEIDAAGNPIGSVKYFAGGSWRTQ